MRRFIYNVLKPMAPWKIKLLAVAGALIAVGAFAVASAWSDGLLFESLESKTTQDGPVFNRIKWFAEKDRDIWMMQQSHAGLMAPADRWDRLAIVVNKTTKTAKFYQLEPGPLQWQEGMREKPLKVACFMCHSNGLRAIRPNLASAERSLSWGARLQVLVWNLRIKSYGRLRYDRSHEHQEDFRFQGQLENQPLQVRACLRCHRDSGPLARGTLRRQQAITINFMVVGGHMPPLGMKLSPEERYEIDVFLKGF